MDMRDIVLASLISGGSGGGGGGGSDDTVTVEWTLEQAQDEEEPSFTTSMPLSDVLQAFESGKNVRILFSQKNVDANNTSVASSVEVAFGSALIATFHQYEYLDLEIRIVAQIDGDEAVYSIYLVPAVSETGVDVDGIIDYLQNKVEEFWQLLIDRFMSGAPMDDFPFEYAPPVVFPIFYGNDRKETLFATFALSSSNSGTIQIQANPNMRLAYVLEFTENKDGDPIVIIEFDQSYETKPYFEPMLVAKFTL